MGGVPVLLAVAALGVDYGYQPDGNGGVEYIIQVTPEELEHARKAGQISSVVDPEVRGRVSRFVLRVGNDQLPRDPGPPPARSANQPDDNDLAHVPAPEIDQGIRVAKPQEPSSMELPPDPAAGPRRPRTESQNLANQSRALIDDARQQGRNLADQAAGAVDRFEQRMADPLGRLGGNNATANTDPDARSNRRGTAAAGARGGAFPSTNPYRNQENGGAAGNDVAASPAPGSSRGANRSGQTNRQTADASNPPYPSTQREPQAPATNNSSNYRDDRWKREPSLASGAGASTPMRSAADRQSSAFDRQSSAAAGNFGAPPAGVNDVRLQTNGSNLASGTNNQGNSGYAPNPAANDGYDRIPTGQYSSTASQPNAQQPGYGSNINAATQNRPRPEMRGEYGPAPFGNDRVGYNNPGAAGYGPPTPAGYGNGPTSGYVPPPQSQPTGPPGPRYASRLQDDEDQLLLQQSAASDADSEKRRPGTAAASGDQAGLPQQVFNGLLLLSLVANAYLIIHMSKLIQRYRDLRINLRSATSSQTVAAG